MLDPALSMGEAHDYLGWRLLCGDNVVLDSHYNRPLAVVCDTFNLEDVTVRINAGVIGADACWMRRVVVSFAGVVTHAQR